MVRGRQITGLSLAAAMALGFASTPTLTQAQDVPPVNSGNITLEAGADVVTEYWFRGIGQQNEGFIFQPYAALGVALPEMGGLEPTLNLGTWNSFHDRGHDAGGKWYEADFLIGLEAEVSEGLTADVAYITYRNPANDTNFASEIAFGLAYDDTDFMAEHGIQPLNPHAVLAIETQGSADGSGTGGTYLELGIKPEIELIADGDFPVTLTVPATVGFSLNNYYRDDTGRDRAFGYFDLGFVAGVPLRFIPREYGDWSASAGLHLLWLGDTTKRLSELAGTGSDNFNTYGRVGIRMTY